MIELIAKFCRENPEIGRRIADEYIAKQTDPGKIARLEFFREYNCNPEFRQRVTDYIWEQTSA